MAERHKQIRNLEQIPENKREKGDRFAFSSKRIGVEAGNKIVGCTWYELPPEKESFPHHFHCANEESIFILSGEGEVRINDTWYPIKQNDFASFPPGPENSHSLKNTGKNSLTYLCLSSMLPTDVVGYPDSKKIGIFGSSDAGKGFFTSSWLMKIIKDQESVDYYEGEEL
ncbi:MAG: cupin domain-containing protein [Oligoflexales bacterium]